MAHVPPDPEMQFGELLAKYDEALAAGADVTPVVCPIGDTAVQQRFERIQACLQLLERDRRRQVDLACQQDVLPQGEAPTKDFEQTPDAFQSHATDAGQIASSFVNLHQIGRFRLIRRLGSGGFGVVFLADDPVLKRLVAIKVPRPETLTTVDLQQRFIRESQIVARLTHPHLVSIYEAGQLGPISYQVTAYCAGGTLTSWLNSDVQNNLASHYSEFQSPNEQNELPADKDDLLQKKESRRGITNQRQLPMMVSVELLIGLAEGVQYAHEQGILHRDLKPSNILLHPKREPSGTEVSIVPGSIPLEHLCTVFQPMVSDFGLAKLFDDRDGCSPSSGIVDSQGFSLTSMAGTPQYMAPEQMKGDGAKIGPATDIFGLGAILYEVLAGRKAFPHRTMNDRNFSSDAEQPTPIRQFRPECPRDLEAICLKCLKNSVTDRYASARELADDLRAFQRGESVVARPWPLHERLVKWSRRRPAVASLLLFSVCLLVGMIGFGTWHLYRLSQLNEELKTTIAEREKQTKAAQQHSERADEQEKVAQEKTKLAILENRRSQVLSWISSHRRYAETMSEAADLFQKQLVGPLRISLQGFLPSAGSLVEEVRGFEWRYLFQQTSHFRDLKGHTDTVLAAALTPDGKTCFSVSLDGTIRRWDPVLGRLEKTWDVASLTKEGKARINRAVTRAVILRTIPEKQSHEVIVWDFQQEKELTRKEFPNCRVIAISPDGTWAAMGSDKKGLAPVAVTFWQLDSGDIKTSEVPRQCLLYPQYPALRVSTLAVTSDGKQMAAGVMYATSERSGDHFQLYQANLKFCENNPATPRQQSPEIVAWTVLMEEDVGVGSVLSFDNGGTCVEVGLCGTNINSWDWNQGTLLKWSPVWPSDINLNEPLEQTAPVSPAMPAISEIETSARPSAPVNRHQRDIERWNWKLKKDLPFPTRDIVNCIQFHKPSGTWVIGEEMGHLSLWRLEPVLPHRDLKGHQPREAWALAFSPNGKTIYSVGDDHGVRVWDVATGDEIALGRQHTSLASCVAASPDGRWIATGSYDDDVILWQTNPFRYHSTLKGHTHDVRRVAFSPDSKTLASAGRDKVIRLWTVPDGESMGVRESHQSDARAIAFSSNDQFVEANTDGRIIAWHPDGTSHQIRAEHEGFRVMAFAPPGSIWRSNFEFSPTNADSLMKIASLTELAVVGDNNGTIKLLHLPNNDVWHEHTYHTGEIRSVAFSPDGRTFAVATSDNAVRLWHAATCQELLAFTGLPAQVNQIAFSPDGEHLAAALHDGTIRLWHGPTTDRP